MHNDVAKGLLYLCFWRKFLQQSEVYRSCASIIELMLEPYGHIVDIDSFVPYVGPVCEATQIVVDKTITELDKSGRDGGRLARAMGPWAVKMFAVFRNVFQEDTRTFLERAAKISMHVYGGCDAFFDDARGQILRDMENVQSDLSSVLGRDCTASELIEGMRSLLDTRNLECREKGFDTQRLYMRVTTYGAGHRAVGDKFKEYLKKYSHLQKGVSYYDSSDPAMPPILFPQGNFKPKQLALFLKAHRLKQQGATHAEISQKIARHFDLSGPDRELAIETARRYCKRAEKIIANAEMGVFPGRY